MVLLLPHLATAGALIAGITPSPAVDSKCSVVQAAFVALLDRPSYRVA